MYNYYQPQNQPPRQSYILKGHPVSSLDEVRALSVDFDGLGEDITDMVKTSSPEEKQLLSSKLQQLATKINK